MTDTLDRLERLYRENAADPTSPVDLTVEMRRAYPSLLKIAQAAQEIADELPRAATKPRGTVAHEVIAALDKLIAALGALDALDET